MSFEEGQIRDRMERAEAQAATLRDQIERMKGKVRDVCAALCAKEISGGGFQIDFAALADKLGVEQCLELRKIIDDRWKISGEPGEKPRLRVVSG